MERYDNITKSDILINTQLNRIHTFGEYGVDIVLDKQNGVYELCYADKSLDKVLPIEVGFNDISKQYFTHDSEKYILVKNFKQVDNTKLLLYWLHKDKLELIQGISTSNECMITVTTIGNLPHLFIFDSSCVTMTKSMITDNIGTYIFTGMFEKIDIAYCNKKSNFTLNTHINIIPKIELVITKN